MKHLTSVELVDLLEGTLEPSRAGHVSSCERCWQQAHQLRAALAEARDVDAPEPSPLFWGHFSARVRDAVAAEAPPRSAPGFLWRPAWGVSLATAVVLLVVVITVRRPTPVVPAAPAPASAAGESASSDWLAALDSAPDDGSWNLVTTVAEGVAWDETESAGLSPRPGTVDREVFLLTSEERSELARLLRAELPRGES